MKKNRRGLMLLILSFVAAVQPTCVAAATVYWDASPANNGQLDPGTGTWGGGASSLYWNPSSTGAASPGAWTNGNTAAFNASVAGSSTVSLAGSVSGNLNFSPPVASQTTIGTVVDQGGHKITIGANGMGGGGNANAIINAAVVFNGNQDWTISSGGKITVYGTITETNGARSFNTHGSTGGGVYLYGTNNQFSGPVSILGAPLYISKLANGDSNSSIGRSDVTAGNLTFRRTSSAGNCALTYTGAGDTSDRLFTINSSAYHTTAQIFSSGTGALWFTNTGALGVVSGSNVPTLHLDGTYAGAPNRLAGTLSGSTTALTKAGNGTWILTGANTHGGPTTISGGTLQLGDGTSGNDGLIGSDLMTNNATLVFSLFSSQTNSSAMAGTGKLIKNGTGALSLAGTNTYTGTTSVSNGTLQVVGGLGVTTVTVATNGTLSGSGTIRGATTIQAGGKLIPGLGGADNSALTLSNTLTLAGNVIFSLNRNYSPNTAKVRGLTTVTYGGTLTLTNLGGALQSGDTFTLFEAVTDVGSFTTRILPPLQPGLSWHTNSLTNGIISVVGTATLPTLGITASNLNKSFGQTLTFAGTEFTANGLTGGDTVTNVTLTSSGAAAGANAGVYPIVASLALGTGLTNYNIIYTNGTLTVNPAVSELTLASAQNPTAFGSGSFFAANITPALTGGSVQFLTNGTLFDIQPVANGVATSGQAFNLPLGTNLITAIFTGSANLLPATNTLSQVVTALTPGATGLTGHYYDNTNFTTLRTNRTDANVDFDWGAGIPPGSGLTSATSYSVAWSGQLQPNYDELYTFYLTADDGARLWVDDQVLVARTFMQGNGELRGQMRLKAGHRVNLRIEFINYTGNALARLEWSSASQAREVIPTWRLFPTENIPNGGAVIREVWSNLPGTDISSITNSPNYPNQPASRETLTSLECLATNWADNYGTKVTGWIRAPQSGVYNFAVSASDTAQFFLSSNATTSGKAVIASVTSATAFQDWTAQPSQQSAPQLLLAGNEYYFELWHKAGTNFDHWSVAWKQPGATNLQIISGLPLVMNGTDLTRPTQTNLFNTLATEQPRILATKERFTWLKQQYDSPVSSSVKSRVQAILSAADTALTSTQAIDPTDRFFDEALENLAVAWWVTGQTNYAERVWEAVEPICTAPGDWNYSFGPMNSFRVGISLDWLYPYWSPSRRSTMTSAIMTKGQNWPGNTDNIGSVHYSCAIVGALAVGTADETNAEKMLNTALNTGTNIIGIFEPNAGAWQEGTMYGVLAKQYVGPAFAGMESALGSAWFLATTPGVSLVAREPYYIRSNDGDYFTFSDVGTSSLLETGWRNWWTRRFAKGETWAMNRAGGNQPVNVLMLTDETSPNQTVTQPPPDILFRGPFDSFTGKFQDVVTLRGNWTDPDATFVGTLGGSGSFGGHAMLQSGSFQIRARGQRWFLDLKSDDYEAPGYFDTTFNSNGSPYRWDYYRCRAEGHNTLVINPYLGPDRIPSAFASVVNFQSDAAGDASFSVTDMTPTITGASKVQRGVQLFNNRSHVLVQDEISMTNASTVWWFAHYSTTANTINISPDQSSVTMTQGSDSLWLKILNGAGVFTNLPATPLVTWPTSVTNDPNVGVNKLAILLTGVTNTTLAVWMVPLGTGQNPPTNLPTVIPLSQWLLLPPGTPVPATPGILAAAPAPNSMALTWVDNATNELSYLLERAPAPGTNFVQIANLAAGTTNYTDIGLTAATTYHYRLRAYAGLDRFSAYATVMATTLNPLASPLVWSGSVNGNWDINTTVNWIQDALPAFYGEGYLAQFDDSAAGLTAVVLTTNVLPGSLTFSNSLLAYTLSSPGGYGVGGSVGLTKSGTNSLVIWNPNTFTGPTVVNAGTLQLGDGTAGHDGSLASSISNNAALVFNLFSNQTYNAALSGTGTLTKRGVGTLTLTGTNNFSGATAVSGAGALVVSGSGAIAPTSGATLTLGTGGSAGTFQHNSSATSRFGTGIVGNGTVSPGTLNQTAGTLLFTSLTLNNGYSGSGQGTVNLDGGTMIVSGAMVGSSQVANTTTFSTINVSGSGALIVGNGLKLTGAPAAGRSAQCTVNQTNGTVTVANGLTLARTTAANTATRTGIYNLVGGTLNVNQVNQDTGVDTVGLFNFNGGTLKATTNHSAFLQGLTTAKVQANGAKIDDGGFAITIAQPLLADGALPGGGLTKLGAGTLRLTGTNTYTGATLISNGVLQVSGALGTGAVSVVSGGTLSGAGMVGGAVSVAPGGMLSPGDGVGAFTVSNNITVSGNLFFELNKSLSPARSNDIVLVTGALTNAATGTLTVSNLGPALVVGDTFTLFSQPLANGAALTIIPPGGVTFTNKLAYDGSIQVLTSGSTAAYPTNISSSVSGNTLTISWPATHLGWILQSQTNTLNVGLATNWVDIAGTASVTATNLTIMSATPAAFYRLRHP